MISALVCMVIMLVSSSVFAAGILVKEGSHGHDVITVQRLLKEKGFYFGAETGECDKATVAAIKKFQAAEGILVDGVCGPQTYRRLDPPKAPAGLENARRVMVHASAYSPVETGPRTATGTRLRKGVIASDPNFIPMGTRVYIPDYGEAVAEDMGSSIVDNTIDIAFDTHEEALAFGRQHIEIYILD
ncbi:MAG: peptidoglycan-binding protein [Anaerovibrio sp.]|nr:peptidoglycan-binding protein [Anaerovibrio sp.]